MESLGDILKRITQRNISKSTNGVGDTFLGSHRGSPLGNQGDSLPDNLPGSVQTVNSCPICQGAGWVSKQVPVGHPDFGEAIPCRCQEEEGSPAAHAES